MQTMTAAQARILEAVRASNPYGWTTIITPRGCRMTATNWTTAFALAAEETGSIVVDSGGTIIAAAEVR